MTLSLPSLKTRKRRPIKKCLLLCPLGGDPKWLKGGEISAYAYEMCGHVKQTVDRYLELAGKPLDSLKKVATPCIDDHQIPPEEFTVKGDFRQSQLGWFLRPSTSLELLGWI